MKEQPRGFKKPIVKSITDLKITSEPVKSTKIFDYQDVFKISRETMEKGNGEKMGSFLSHIGHTLEIREEIAYPFT